MSLKVAAAIAALGLVLALSSVLYGLSSPTAGKAEETKERIESAVSRHARVVDVEKAEDAGKKTDEARARLAEIKRKNDELIAARESAIKRHNLIISVLRYSGSLCMLVGAVTFLLKTQNND